MQAEQEELDGRQEVVGGSAERPPAQQAQGEAQRDKARVLCAVGHIFSPLCAEDDPGVVHVAEGGSCYAGRTVVKILVDVHVKQRVQIHEIFIRSY